MVFACIDPMYGAKHSSSVMAYASDIWGPGGVENRKWGEALSSRVALRLIQGIAGNIYVAMSF